MHEINVTFTYMNQFKQYVLYHLLPTHKCFHWTMIRFK